MNIKQAVLFCGGVGERLKPLTENIPKPMVDINGKPFLEHLLNQLKEQGISEFVLCTGYKKEIIEDYFGNGSRFGIKIKYSRGPTEWLTSKRLLEAKELLDDNFIILYADNYVPSFDLKESIKFHLGKNKTLSFIVFSKPEKNNLRIINEVITLYDKTRVAEDLKYVELGYMITNKDKVFEFITDLNVSFSEVIKSLVEKKEIAGLKTKYQYHSISDIERLEKMKNYLYPKKIILIDKDGVITQKAPRGEYILKKDDAVFIEDSINTMKYLSEKGFNFIIITNQPAVSKGLITKQELEDLHNHLLEKLKEKNINILDIFYCPHGIDEGCYCRKPNPGMLIEACNKHFINPKKTIFIGDDERDCLAAVRAGCDSILMGDHYNLDLNVKYHNIYVEPNHSSKNLSDTLDFIIQKFDNQ